MRKIIGAIMLLLAASAQLSAQDCDSWEASFLENALAIQDQEGEVHAQYCTWEFYDNGGNNPFAVEMNEANAAIYWGRYQDELLMLDVMDLEMSLFIIDMGIAGCL